MLWGAMDSVAGALPSEYRGSVRGFLESHGLPAPSRSAE
jgi:hypothetical protein